MTKANQKELFVFLLPVALELDLKKAAKAAGVKKLEMLPLKDLTKETGYVRGGCSAVGMKRKYPTFIDERIGTRRNHCKRRATRRADETYRREKLGKYRKLYF